MDTPLFCDHCHSLYPPDGLNYFELLGLTPTFDVDEQTLRQKYLQVSRGVHPDRHGKEPDPAASLRAAAQLNEANRILRDPVLRAEYLLELHGGKSAAEDKSVPQEVLNETLLLRDELEEAQADGDDTALRQCREMAQQKVAVTRERVADLARRLPGDETLQQELRAALNTIKYYQKLLSEA